MPALQIEIRRTVNFDTTPYILTDCFSDFFIELTNSGITDS
jgi:hypothetical protein